MMLAKWHHCFALGDDNHSRTSNADIQTPPGASTSFKGFNPTPPQHQPRCGVAIIHLFRICKNNLLRSGKSDDGYSSSGKPGKSSGGYSSSGKSGSGYYDSSGSKSGKGSSGHGF